jgi:hypothetical protein
MRAVVIVGVLMALSVLKVHTMPDDYGRPVSRVALGSPVSMPFDSAAAECLREWQEPIPLCARAFQNRSRVKIFDAPLCSACAQAARALAFSSMSADAAAGRRRDIADAGII